MKNKEVKDLFKEYGRTITNEGLRYLCKSYGIGEKIGTTYVFYENRVIDYLEKAFPISKGRPKKFNIEG
jgi:hypothetical protein